MRLSLGVTNFAWPGGPAGIGPRVAQLARTADQAGFDTFWAMDHFFQIPYNGPAEDPMLEAYSLLSFVAGQTERIRLGTMVTAVPYRHPGVLVKTVTTLDVLSGGRAWLGLGAAWNDAESAALGIPFPGTTERYERLEEVLQIAKQMWRGDESAYRGAHYVLERPVNSPNTLQRSGPPILIGGAGERKTLRLVAQYADACNLFDNEQLGGTDFLKRKLDVLRAHCEAVGRPYEEIEKTTFGEVAISRDGRNGTSSPAQFVEHLADLAAHGIDHAVVEPAGPWELAELELVGELVPQVERIQPNR